MQPINQRVSVEAIVDEVTRTATGALAAAPLICLQSDAAAGAQARAELAARATLLKIATKGCVGDVLAALAAVGAPGDLGEYHQRLQAATPGSGR